MSESTTTSENLEAKTEIPADVAAAGAETNTAEAKAHDTKTETKTTETAETPEFLDFEVSADRAAFIREQVQSLRDLEVMSNFQLLAKELGEELLETDEDGTTQLPGFSKKGDNPLVFTAPEGHSASGLQVALQNTDLKLLFEQKPVLELSFLPKDGEYVVFYMDETRIQDLKTWIESLSDFVTAAKAKKAERQAKWKSRFKKN